MLRLRHLALTLTLAVLPLTGVSLPVFAVAPRMASAHVQTKQNNATGAGSTVAITFDSSVTAGNFIVCGAFGSGAFSSIAGNSNTYVQVADDATNPYMRVWTVKSANSGSTTITVTMGSTFLDRLVSCSEYSGLDSANDYDKVSISSGFSTTCNSGTTATLSSSASMAVGYCGEAGTAAITAGGSFTDRGSTATAARTLESADKSISGTSGVSYTATWSGSTSWRAAVVVISDASAASSFVPGIINAPVRGGGRVR